MIIFSLTLPFSYLYIFNYVGDYLKWSLTNWNKQFASVVVIDQIRQAIATFYLGIAAANYYCCWSTMVLDKMKNWKAANAILAFVVSLVT